LRAYQSILPQIRSAGARLIAVSAQTPDNSLTTAEKHALEFDVLSDAGNVLARTYGLVFRLPDGLRPYYERIGVSLEAYNGDSSWELPMPAIYVVDQSGIISFAHVDADYTRRLEPRELLAALAALSKVAEPL
jgi:peroxiredoxin